MNTEANVGPVRLAALLEESLAEAGWQVDVVHDGRSAHDPESSGSVTPAATPSSVTPSLSPASTGAR